MLPRPAEPRQTDAAQAQAAHEGGEQNAERDRGRSNGELKKLIPDDLVNQRREAAARKQDEQERKKARGVLGILHGTESPMIAEVAAPASRNWPGQSSARYN